MKKIYIVLSICLFLPLAISLFYFNKRDNSDENKDKKIVTPRTVTLGGRFTSRNEGSILRKAVRLFTEEIRSNQIRITIDERGIVISISSDVIFNSASATINIEASHEIFFKLAILFSSEELMDYNFLIEGHTDSTPVDSTGYWISNWHLSYERALSVLYYLNGLSVSEDRMRIVGLGSAFPVVNDTKELRIYNRRIDIILINNDIHH